MQYSVPAVEIQRVFRFYFEALLKYSLTLASLFVLAGAGWWFFTREVIESLVVIAVLSALLLFLLSVFYFLSINVMLAYRSILFILLVIQSVAALHLLEFNFFLGVLAVAAILLLYSVVSFSAMHWFAYGQLLYTLDAKGISVHLQYRGKDLLVRFLTRFKNVNKWSAYTKAVYEPRANILRLKWHRTGIQLLLLPENSRQIIGFVRKHILHKQK